MNDRNIWKKLINTAIQVEPAMKMVRDIEIITNLENFEIMKPSSRKVWKGRNHR